MVNIIGLLGLLIFSIGCFIPAVKVKQIILLIQLIVILIIIILIIRKKYHYFIKSIYVLIINVLNYILLFTDIIGKLNIKVAQIFLILLLAVFSVIEIISDHNGKHKE